MKSSNEQTLNVTKKLGHRLQIARQLNTQSNNSKLGHRNNLQRLLKVV